jgi:hypothetical protein
MLLDSASDLTRLDRDVYNSLLSGGYKYFVITDVELCPAKQFILGLSLRAVKALPANMLLSCTGIADAMVTAYILDPKLNCKVYLDGKVDEVEE